MQRRFALPIIFAFVSVTACQARSRHKESDADIRQHKNATIAVMSGIEGMTLLQAEQAANAATRAIRQAVNSAAGFAII